MLYSPMVMTDKIQTEDKQGQVIVAHLDWNTTLKLKLKKEGK